MNHPILLKGGRVVDPISHRDEIADLFIRNGLIAPVPKSLQDGTQVVDAAGKVIAPGFIDMHVHLREPGLEEAETIASGAQAAVHGGFTTIVAMPNTKPPLDNADNIALQYHKAKQAESARVLPSGCITQQRQGQTLADLKALVQAGAVALTDDGNTVTARETMKEAIVQAAELEIPIMDHAEDPGTEPQGVMHDGKYSRIWHLPGIPSWTEARVVLRDVELAESTGCPVHIQHVSTMDSIEIIRRAQTRGIPVTGEATPHHLMLTDKHVDPENACFKMNPPLRGDRDRESLRQAVVDGTIEAFATDHAPHTQTAKNKGFLNAPFGVVGLETAVGVTYTCMVKTALIDLTIWIKRWTVGPARILGLPMPSLKVGQPADVVVLDLNSEWTVHSKDFLSKSTNTPFENMKLTGQAICTICNGRVAWMKSGLKS